MFSVIFEAQPRPGQQDIYLDSAAALRLELQEVPDFIDNARYKSLTRDDWILSLSSWRSDQAVVGRRTEMEEAGRGGILLDYYLRAGQTVYDTRLPDGGEIVAPNRDRADDAEGTAITLIDAKQASDWVASRNPQEIATFLGFDHNSFGDCISWDVFNSVQTPGDVILLVVWKDGASALEFAQSTILPDEARVRVVQIVRDDAHVNQ